MKRLLGWIVLIGMIVFGLSYVIGHWPNGSKFGCGVAGVVMAQADTAGGCVTVDQAATDPSWAQKQQAGIRSAYFDHRPVLHQQRCHRADSHQRLDRRAVGSGRRQPADLAELPKLLEKAKPTVAADVETKIAEMMRESGATNGVVAINHPKMCDGAMGCTTAVAAILPVGSVLHVWELDATTAITISGKAAA